MTHRTGADKLVADSGTVGTLRLVSADHAGMVFSGDRDAAQMVVFLSEAGMMLGAFGGFLQSFDRYIESSGAMHDEFLTFSPE